MEPNKKGGQYQFTSKENYEDYSSGRVLYGATGSTNFPVRLANEIFLRSINYLEQNELKAPYTIWDPFCGAGYYLTILGLLNADKINTIYASDINKDVLKIAQKNLSLLTSNGFKNRLEELDGLYRNYKKISHQEALRSAVRIASNLKLDCILIKCFQHDILNKHQFPFKLKEVNLIIADLPYGKLTDWQHEGANTNPTQRFLDNLNGKLNPNTLIAISTNKKQELSHRGYVKLKSFKIGTRKVLFLRLDAG